MNLLLLVCALVLLVAAVPVFDRSEWAAAVCVFAAAGCLVLGVPA